MAALRRAAAVLPDRFAFDRVKALAPQHPDWQTKEPFKSALAGDWAYGRTSSIGHLDKGLDEAKPRLDGCGHEDGLARHLSPTTHRD
jgi:hypothetical protein